MSRADLVWKKSKQARHYLEGTRAAIPLANEQIELMIRLIKKALPNVESFIDIGCGNGILGMAIYDAYPEAVGVFTDFSETMMDAAKENLACNSREGHVIEADMSNPDWREKIRDHGPFDVAVSGFSIHHQPGERKREIYAEVLGLLKPGGIFLNLDNVSSPTKWLGKAFEEHLIDSMYDFYQAKGKPLTKEEIYDEWKERRQEDLRVTNGLEEQLKWLRGIGYEDVDCYIKILELAMFGGRRSRGDSKRRPGI